MSKIDININILAPQELSLYDRLSEAKQTASIIEAAETGYVSLNRTDIRELDEKLLRMIKEIYEIQSKKVADAATTATDETH